MICLTVFFVKGGELDVTDGMTPLDVIVRILNNQLSSLMWIDEKVSMILELIIKIFPDFAILSNWFLFKKII